MIALALACTLPWPQSPPPPGVFPHPPGYGDTPLPHGLEARAPGAPCFTCHTTDTCAECHPSYPHVFPTDQAHPRVVDECTTCHTDPAAMTAAEVPCTTCHASYPHPDRWEEAGQHGTYALARGDVEAVCGSCHGPVLSGGAALVGCAECHALWPHPAAFDHGAAAVADITACTGCHGEQGDGGRVGVPCSTCHLAYPHPPEFATTGHLPVAAERGESTCLVCHDPGDGPPTMVAPCGAVCHGGKP